MSQSGRRGYVTARQVLAEIFHRRPAEVPVAHVDLINHQTGLEDNRVGDHRIVERINAYRRCRGPFGVYAQGQKGKAEWAPTPLRYSFVSVILSVLIVTSRQ